MFIISNLNRLLNPKQLFCDFFYGSIPALLSRDALVNLCTLDGKEGKLFPKHDSY